MNPDSETALGNCSDLEIYITAECNQNCEYCYINNPQLYPRDKMNHENILHNLRLLYDYIMINNFHIPTLDMFSGEIWHSQLGLDVLDITLEYLRKGMRINTILIPSNCSFVMNDQHLQKLQEKINMIHTFTSCHVSFSISVDGAVIDNFMRPRNNKIEYTEEFYDRLFTFAKVNGYLFHPMVASASVHLWKENYEWWKKKLKEYNINGYILDNVMMLEVRNNDWTSKTIKEYCDFITYTMEDFLVNDCKSDIKTFATSLANVRGFENSSKFVYGGYVPWTISKVDKIQSCTIGQTLTVRLGDLAICPCHRMAYDSYLYGQFVVENDQIVDIAALNPIPAIKIFMGNAFTSTPICNKCYINEYCFKGCLGSQLENNKDPFFPIHCVCTLFREKQHTIIEFLRKYGIIQFLSSISAQELNSTFALHILQAEKLDKENYQDELGTY